MMQKTLLLIAALCSTLCLYADIYSGYCGKTTETDIQWQLNTATGELTLTGTGEMKEYSANYPNTPWYDHRDSLLSLTVGEGITNIGFAAFYSLYKLESVSLPSTLTDIQGWAFGYCNHLLSVTLPEGLTELEGAAFHDCSRLASANIPASLTTIGNDPFGNCPSLTEPLYNSRVLACVPKKYVTAHKGYCVPSGITDIAGDFISGADWVAMPASVARIGAYTFFSCKSSLVLIMDGEVPPSIGDYFMKQYNSTTRAYDIIPCKIYVPSASALTAYQAAWGSDYNFAVGTAADYLQTLTAPHIHFTLTRNGEQVLSGSDLARTADIRSGAGSPDQLWIHADAGEFFAYDSVLAQVYYRNATTPDEDISAKLWGKATGGFGKADSVRVRIGTSTKVDHQEFKVQYVYTIGGKKDTVESANTLTANYLFPMTFATMASDAAENTDYISIKGEDLTWNHPGDTLWFRSGDTLRFVMYGTVSGCTEEQVKIADIAHKFTDMGADTIMTVDSEFNPYVGQYCSVFVPVTGPYAVVGQYADSVSYTFYDSKERTHVLGSVKAECGTNPVLPEMTMPEGKELDHWVQFGDEANWQYIQQWGITFSSVNAYYYAVFKEKSAVESIPAELRATKVVSDGQVLILRGGKTYDVTGREISK